MNGLDRLWERRALVKLGALVAPSLAAMPLARALAAEPADQSQNPWPAPSQTIELWPSPPPGARNPAMREEIEETSKTPGTHFRRTHQLTRPRLEVFPAARPNGAAMIIVPGGGFVWQYFDHEGYQIADYLNQHGITACVLFHRLAQDGWAHPADVAISDGQRAIRVLRSRAASLQIDPARIGVMGFSAGGFVATTLQTRHGDTLYAPVDSVDSLSARPYLVAPIYPVQSAEPGVAYADMHRVLFGGTPTAAEIATYSPERHVDARSAPGFYVHCEDDGAVPVANSTRMVERLRAAGISVEAHLFARGGHGFGFVTDAKSPLALWPKLFLGFAQTTGLIPA